MIYLFSAAYILAASIIVAETWRIARKVDQRNTLKRRLQEWHAQERIAATSAYVDNLPPPAHPQCRSVVQPAYVYDASDTTEESEFYCPACALGSVVSHGLRTADGDYPLPRGKRVLCGPHAAEWEQRLDGDVL